MITNNNNVDFDYTKAVKKFNKIADRGFCYGMGNAKALMCVEAAICVALDLPFGDQPKCVTPAISSYKVTLNDRDWASPTARADGLRNLGIAQLGSKGVISNDKFNRAIQTNHIKILYPYLLRNNFKKSGQYQSSLDLALECEAKSTKQILTKIHHFALYNSFSLKASVETCVKLDMSASLQYLCNSISNECADNNIQVRTKKLRCFLRLVSSSTLQVLKDLNSPGCKYLREE